MHIETLLGYLIEYRYILIIPLTIIEGPIVMVLCGFLYHLGFFGLPQLYISLTLADLSSDVAWYAIGRVWGMRFVKRFGKFFSLTEDGVTKVTNLFHKHHNKIIFISKVTMGFGFAIVTQIAAGMSKVSFKKYLSFNVSGQLVWTAVLLGVGYFFGNIYTTVDKSFRAVTLAALIIMSVLIVYGLGKYVSKRIGEKL